MVTLLYEVDADSGCGEAAAPELPPGRDPREFAFGVNSNNGARSGATPYCTARSFPLSRGILPDKFGVNVRGEGTTDRNVPCSLIFTITALHNLVFPGEDLLLDDLGAASFIDASDLQYLCRIHVRVSASAHDGNTSDHALINLGMTRLQR
jgi:hypothetical protein